VLFFTYFLIPISASRLILSLATRRVYRYHLKIPSSRSSHAAKIYVNNETDEEKKRKKRKKYFRSLQKCDSEKGWIRVEILGCRWGRMQKDGKKARSSKTSNLPITVRHASHLTKFIPKRGDAKPSAVYNPRIDVW